MKKLIKSAAILAALLGSGLTQAANTTASIPMGVDVPRSCTLANVSSSVVVPEDGTEVTGGFSMICNINSYSFKITTDSLEMGSLKLKNNNDGLPLQIHVIYMVNSTKFGEGELGIGTRNWNSNGVPTGQPQDAILKFKLTNPTTATTPAGVYTDTFHVNVNY